MKKLQSTWYNMAVVLTAISVVAGAALASVNELTKEPIAQIKAQQLADGIKAVLGADEVTVEATDSLASGAVIFRTDRGNAVQVTDPKGFGGALTVLVGFDEAGAIQGYRVLESSETPGLGAKADTWFQQGQKGCIIGKRPAEKALTVSKDGGEIDAITASTITSRAFLRCVNAAYAALTSGEEADTETGATRKAAPSHEAPAPAAADAATADTTACDTVYNNI